MLEGERMNILKPQKIQIEKLQKNRWFKFWIRRKLSRIRI